MEVGLCCTGVAMESLLSSVMEALLAEISISVMKILFGQCTCITTHFLSEDFEWKSWHLVIMGSRTSVTIEFPEETRQLERLLKTDFYVEKRPDPETKDATETEVNDEENDDGKDEEDDDGGEDEEDFSGEEEDDEDDRDTEDEPEANGDGGSGDDDDEEGEDDDEGGEEEEEEEDEEDDEETPRPPAKKRK